MLSCLLFQTPSQNSKAKDHPNALEEILEYCYEGKRDTLVKENRTIQDFIWNSSNTKHTQDDRARLFAKLIGEGKIQASLKILSKDYKNGALKIDDDILSELKSKYPTAAEVKQDSLIFSWNWRNHDSKKSSMSY